MRSTVAPAPYAFYEALRTVINNHTPYIQAIAFWLGQRRFHLSQKTMAGMAGCTVSYVAEILLLLGHSNGDGQMTIEGFLDILFPVQP
jgi:hypothetical protein